MNKLAAAALSAAIVAAGLWATTSPAAALGGCGPNRHRNAYGYCVWGGQNQAWCLRHTGHFSNGGPYGTRWCNR